MKLLKSLETKGEENKEDVKDDDDYWVLKSTETMLLLPISLTLRGLQ